MKVGARSNSSHMLLDHCPFGDLGFVTCDMEVCLTGILQGDPQVPATCKGSNPGSPDPGCFPRKAGKEASFLGHPWYAL